MDVQQLKKREYFNSNLYVVTNQNPVFNLKTLKIQTVVI